MNEKFLLLPILIPAISAALIPALHKDFARHKVVDHDDSGGTDLCQDFRCCAVRVHNNPPRIPSVFACLSIHWHML